MLAARGTTDKLWRLKQLQQFGTNAFWLSDASYQAGMNRAGDETVRRVEGAAQGSVGASRSFCRGMRERDEPHACFF